jgi:NAD(P)-dependent dehydrogenase (short-subunit alcohol dehydrogenase family)
LAAEWSVKGVRVNCVAPGFIERDVEPLKDDAVVMEWIFSRTPLKRFGHPREVALAVLFLASDAASYVTGTTLAVDGGWLAT